MSQEEPRTWSRGDVIALRYITSDGRIEMCWPCRVVEDSPDVFAVFIAAGSLYKAGPKRSAAEKRRMNFSLLPPDEYVWRKDTLRLMLPGRCHSVYLFWEFNGHGHTFSGYFVNMEEPFRRTAVGIDTQDHTLDIVVSPDFSWSWRDEEELRSHVEHGFYTEDLAQAARAEGESAIDAIIRGAHPSVNGWNEWCPDSDWRVPAVPSGWDTTAPTFWERREWAYGEVDLPPWSAA